MQNKRLISVTQVVGDVLDDQAWAHYGYLKKSRQRGWESKIVVFPTTLIAWSGFNLNHCHVFESLDRTLFIDYFIQEASNKQQIHCKKIHRNPQHYTLDRWKFLSGCGFLQARNTVIIAKKSVQIFQ